MCVCVDLFIEHNFQKRFKQAQNHLLHFFSVLFVTLIRFYIIFFYNLQGDVFFTRFSRVSVCDGLVCQK